MARNYVTYYVLYKKLFIQVNTGEEETKSGIHPNQLEEFLKFCKFDKFDLLHNL